MRLQELRYFTFASTIQHWRRQFLCTAIEQN